MLVAACALGGRAGVARADAPPPSFVLLVDDDDDDANGVPDRSEEKPAEAALVDGIVVDGLDGATLIAQSGTGKIRFVTTAGTASVTRPLPPRTRVVGVEVGIVLVQLTSKKGTKVELHFDVRAAGARDLKGAPIDFTKSHASLVRTPPTPKVDESHPDPDEFELSLTTADGASTPDVDVESYSASGVRLDVLAHIAMGGEACSGAPGRRCYYTSALRLVIDDVDRSHPLARGRALRAEVGGAVVLRTSGRKQALRVAGPRVSAIGPMGRYRVKLRPFVFRLAAGGAPAVGGNDVGAIAMLRAELAVSSSIWGQCGIHFGDTAHADVVVTDPPPPYLLAFGDDVGLPASSGAITIRVDGKVVSFASPARATPDDVATIAKRAIEKLGFVVTLSPNVRISPGAFPSVDLLVRRRDGRFAVIDLAPGVPLSTDPTLSLRIGSVDLSDGLQHFGDMDSMAGTIEERTLAKAVDDGDPQTVEVLVVPFFAQSGRIGESFISSESPVMRNMLFLDRAGIRARRSSFTVAHELGHVLLDMPGHPDDYDIDTPTMLMDSDASDASAFGPRRIPIDECERVIREAGPKSLIPVLSDWPLGPLVIR